MLDFYRNYDVIICPVATGLASSYEKTLAAKEGFNLANDLIYNLPYNKTGRPAAVVRCCQNGRGHLRSAGRGGGGRSCGKPLSADDDRHNH